MKPQTPPKHLLYMYKELKRAPKYFQEMKEKHPDAIILYRMGDYYQAYCEDAQNIADVLGLCVKTHTKHDYRMAWFPHHALDTYLPKLVRAGYRIAICEEP